jgi:ABC-type multidrug transport system fused ATPase/permease subunit
MVGSTFSASATIFGYTVGSLSPCNNPSSIRSSGAFYALLFFVLAIVEFIANFASWSGFGLVSEKVLYNVRVLSFRSLLEQDLAWHQNFDRTPSRLLTHITKDGDALGGLTGSIIGTILSIFVNMVAAIVLTHILAWKIALVCLAVMPIMLLTGSMQMIVLGRFEALHREAFAKSVSITVEAVDQIKTVAALGLEEEILNSYHRSLREPTRTVVRKSLEANIWLAMTYGLPTFVYALAYWWGSKLIIKGEYTQVQFFIVMIALLVSAQLWGQMFTLAPDVSRMRNAAGRIFNLLDLGSTKKLSRTLHVDAQEDRDPEKDVFENTEKPRPTDPIGVQVSFEGVHFSYPARPEAEVLHGIFLSIQAGQFAALVGSSGAGKSTIISLLERMYVPSSGKIRIDGSNICKRQTTSFRNQIALVPQDSVLFEGTVRFNISLGAVPGQEASNEEIENACRLANIHDTIMALKDGYETNIGPNGNQLSGGQKQRLAIARALLRKPRLLLLDEYTSSLDAGSEAALQEALEAVAIGRGMTVIAIAHRLSTIRKADVIFVMDHGEVVDRGTHAELVGRCQSYRAAAVHQGLEGWG